MEDIRYSRQSAIMQQEKLKDCKVAVVGTGAIGTWVGLQLSMLGVGTIYLYDYDKIEIHNLNRQIFTEADVGKYKVAEFAKFLNQVNSEIRIFGNNQKITDVSQLPKDLNYIFSCVDNLKTRVLLNDYVKQANNNCVLFDGGTNERNPTAGTCLAVFRKRERFSRKFDKVDYADYYTDLKEKLKVESNTPSCSANPLPAIVTTTAIIASLMVDNFRKHVCEGRVDKGMFQISLGKRANMDFFALEGEQK